MKQLEEKIVDFAAANGGVISWADFINIALYDEQFGYYRQPRKRVGDGGDFYTSASLKCGVFGQAVEEACATMLEREGERPEKFGIAEIGAEPQYQMVQGAKTIRLGDEIRLEGNVSPVSNELLDARPFERFTFRDGAWRKRAVEFSGSYENRREILMDARPEELDILDFHFPRARVEGFNLDISFDAVKMFEDICLQPWRGALVFADYFRTADELSLLPNGTARTYSKHRDGADLFENVGLADITYSPCCDIFESVAKRCSRAAKTYTQEEFVVKLAPKLLDEIISKTPPTNPRKRELCQLISPANMGACFRVLTAM